VSHQSQGANDFNVSAAGTVGQSELCGYYQGESTQSSVKFILSALEKKTRNYPKYFATVINLCSKTLAARLQVILN